MWLQHVRILSFGACIVCVICVCLLFCGYCAGYVLVADSMLSHLLFAESFAVLLIQCRVICYLSSHLLFADSMLNHLLFVESFAILPIQC